MKLLIVGDSFAADWSPVCAKANGWVNLLAQHHDVINAAQAGSSEYRIMRQIRECYLPGQFDAVVVTHTSPYRLFTKNNPVKQRDALHTHCDLIYSDTEYHAGLLKNLFNHSLHSALGFFQHHFDLDHAEDIYGLIRKEIAQILADTKTVNIETPLVPTEFWCSQSHVVISEDMFRVGDINHMDEKSNHTIFSKVSHALVS
jgi:hypothetical protein